MSETREPWTVSAMLNLNFFKREDMGLFEIEEVHEEVNDLLEQERHGDAEKRVEEVRQQIEALPQLVDACKEAIAATGGSQHWNGWTRHFLILAENALRTAGVDPATIKAHETVGPEDVSAIAAAKGGGA